MFPTALHCLAGAERGIRGAPCQANTQLSDSGTGQAHSGRQGGVHGSGGALGAIFPSFSL